jgi:hypothetical protein
VHVSAAEPALQHVEQSDFVHEEFVGIRVTVNELDDEKCARLLRAGFGVERNRGSAVRV